jgi:enoyl-CoA hydratase
MEKKERLKMETSDYNSLEISRDGDLLRVVVDRKDSDVNAVDGGLHDDFTMLFRELKREKDARAVLLSGRGRAFSAGGDFRWFHKHQSAAGAFHLHRDARQLIWDLLEVELPIVTAIHGYAMGLAANIALFTDTIFMSKTARIADPHVKVGVVAGDGGAVAWPLAVGPARAKQYLMTGDALSADEAERIGLVNFVVEDDQLMERAETFARRLAAGAPMAVRYTKLAVNKLVKDALNTAFDASTGYELLTFMSEDHREAVDAFLNKRTPKFSGR